MGRAREGLIPIMVYMRRLRLTGVPFRRGGGGEVYEIYCRLVKGEHMARFICQILSLRNLSVRIIKR